MEAKLKFARPLAAAFGLIALAGVVPANAADVVREEPPAPAAPMEQPPLNTWSGAYAGVSLGYGFSGRVKEKDINNTINTSGFVGSGFAGYNFQMDNFVAGVEGDVGYGGLKGDNAGVEAKGGINGSLRARLGYAVSPDIMPYVTAGGAAQSVKLTDAAGSDKRTMTGWTAGVGTDVKLTDQVFGRVEYRYTDYGSKNFDTGAGGRDVSARDHRIQFGLGMKF
ncbi:outer membrane protein [Pseudaminobacter soli (ex Li et al. 2025)]|uniref:Porin family protein n=1 Tax=Pseudaminobacter soli (ex Li et al. 2025) TaxID=1295366 RepID=A0A2P7SFF0_9HYPH|nr:outer membrane protein [Mesorhizobium soli]PSJ61219.1 porin family protein [Mesorhizobium soli]